MISALGIDGGCNARQRERCKFEYGEFFEWTCENCEKNPRSKR